MPAARDSGAGTGRSRSRGAERALPAHGGWPARWRRRLAELELAGEARKMDLGRIKRLEIGHGQVNAVVQTRGGEPCRLEIRFAPWSEAQWRAALDVFAEQSVAGGQFAAGDLPIELDQPLVDAGAPLLPAARGEIEIHCQNASCGKDECASALLVFAQLGDALEDDPWLLLRLRGRDHAQLLAGLRSRRNQPAENQSTPAAPAQQSPRFHRTPGDGYAGEDAPSLAAQIGNYWGASKALEGYRPHLAEPKVDVVLLRRLGPLPGGAGETDIYEDLAAVYRAVTRDALRRAFAPDQEGPK